MSKFENKTYPLQRHLYLVAQNAVAYYQLVTAYPQLQKGLTKGELKLIELVASESDGEAGIDAMINKFNGGEM